MSQLSKKIESALVAANYGRVFIRGGLLAYRRTEGEVQATVLAAGGDLVSVHVQEPLDALPRGDFHAAGKLESRTVEDLTAWFETLVTPGA